MQENNIEITEDIIDKLDKYKELLIEWNKKFNLTTIILEEDIYLKHFYDSLCIVKACDPSNKSIMDFGTGAGFPGMVILSCPSFFLKYYFVFILYLKFLIVLQE